MQAGTGTTEPCFQVSFADNAMTYRQKSMNCGHTRVTVFFSGIAIPAFGVAKRRKKMYGKLRDATGSSCYVSI